MAACDDKFHEECGVFAIYDRNRPAALETYYGVFSLQHRGQESAGITVSDGHTMETFRGMGLVTEVFRKLPEKEGFIGIGHVRYSTTGSSIPSNIQPLQLEGAEGPLALAHNGNLVNTKFSETDSFKADLPSRPPWTRKSLSNSLPMQEQP